MSNTYGAPTNLDLSGCNVTATGGTTSQTIADLAKSVADGNTNIATAVQNASSANTNAQAAQTTANAAKLATDNTISKTQINVSGGVAEINTDGTVTVPALNNGNAVINFGRNDEGNSISSGCNAIVFYTTQNGTATGDYMGWNNPDGSKSFGRYLDGTVLTGRSSGSLNIGNSNQPINTVYAQNAAVVTSDASTKTIAGRLTDTSYTDGQKLISAISTVKPTVYQLNASITEKGAENARYHVGYIAQDIEAAITAAGLDPSKFAMWTKTAIFTVTEENGKFTQTASIDSSGNQTYIQMLRYEEIFPVISAGLSENIASLEARVTALEAKNTTSTTGSAA